MLYGIIIGVLIVAIIAVIFFTVSKLLKEKKDYNQFERRYHSWEDDYDDDYHDDKEDDYEPEPGHRPVRLQSERRASSDYDKFLSLLEKEDVVTVGETRLEVVKILREASVTVHTQCHLLNENSDIMSEFFFSTSNPIFLILLDKYLKVCGLL